MIVVLAEDLPPAVRGRMKLWFIEVKPFVFVSGVKDAVARKVVDYLLDKSNDSDSGLIIIESTNKPPYFDIKKKGRNLSYVREISGLPLIFDKSSEG